MEVLEKINWVDIVVLILVVRGVYLGIKHGLTAELFSFIGILLSLVCAVSWYSQIADVLVINFSLPIWLSQLLCFMVIAQLIRIIFKYGLAMLLRVLNVQFLPQLERIGGGVVGFGRGIIISSILLLAMVLISNNYLNESIYQKSFSGTFLLKAAERTYKALTFWLPEEEAEKSIFSTSAATKAQKL